MSRVGDLRSIAHEDGKNAARVALVSELASPLAAIEGVGPEAKMSTSPSWLQGWSDSDRAYRFRLVSAGRLVRRKGYGTTIEALTKLPETELLIAGGDATSESEHDRLTALAEQLGVAERVRLIGRPGGCDLGAT